MSSLGIAQGCGAKTGRVLSPEVVAHVYACWCCMHCSSYTTETACGTDLAEHVLLAQNGDCETSCLLQLSQVYYLVPQSNTQTWLATTRASECPIGQVVQREVTSCWYVNERLHVAATCSAADSTPKFR